jgi:hypothetical protein
MSALWWCIVSIPDSSHKRHRTNDHATSTQGAYDVAFRAGTQKAKILLAYFDHGHLTADEAAKEAGVSMRSCYWKRCSELRDLGFIEPVMDGDYPLNRIGDSGSQQMVCKITRDGFRFVVRNLL